MTIHMKMIMGNIDIQGRSLFAGCGRMSDSQEAIDALDRVISDYNYGICGNRTVDDNATDIEAVRAALQSKPDDVYSPCVSCGKQSDTSTPDDAPM